MNVGIIGTGRMGSSLIDGIYHTQRNEVHVFGYNRTKQKIAEIHNRHPELNVCEELESVIMNSDLVVFAVPFSCIQMLPDGAVTALDKKRPLLIVLCAYTPREVLERLLSSRVIKAYPNINWALGVGVTIVSFGSGLGKKERETVVNFLSKLGGVYEVPEEVFRPFSNLMSCGPALWTKLIALFLDANVTKYGIDRAIGLEVTERTILGTFQLMKEKGYSSEEVIEMVATPNGVTQTALECFERSLPAVFAWTVEQIALKDGERIQKILKEQKETSKGRI